MAEIKLGFNNITTSHMHLGSINEPCLCGCDSVCFNLRNGVVVGCIAYQARHHVYKRSSNPWELYLCPKPPKDLFFKLQCVQGKC